MKGGWRASWSEVHGIGLFCFLLLLMESDAKDLSSDDDGDVVGLLAFKSSSVRSDPNGFLSDWSHDSPRPCSWRGVVCSSAGRVVALHLTNAGLLGSLQFSHLLALHNLRHVNFHCNYFSEGDLSGSYRGTCELQTLDLSANNLTLPLSGPSLLRGCLRLASLNLSRNFIPGGILSFTPSLLLLDLSRNRISDPAFLPRSLLDCQNLNLLNLSDNKLATKLTPSSLSACNNLSTLDLSYNLLSGGVPVGRSSPPSLRLLDLSHNNFSDNLSSNEFGECRNLTLLDLSHNDFSSTDFPPSLRNCQLLETLDLY